MQRQLIKYLLFSLLFFYACANKENAVDVKEENTYLNPRPEYREDFHTWDSAMLMEDLENRYNFDMPFTSGVFPEPAYDIAGKESFKGIGSIGYLGGEGYELKAGDKTILFNALFAKANPFNTEFIPVSEADEVFFHIMVATDYVDTVAYSHTMNEIVSRNHPDYLGQGFFKTFDNRIDYSAFITADRKSYAIVNMRLFDLSKGRTVLIAPQKDGSLHSMQIHSPFLSSKEVEAYSKSLIEEEKVRDFFE